MCGCAWAPAAISRLLYRQKMYNRALLLGLLFVVFLGASPTTAQQVLVNDPTSVPVGAAQLEAWHNTQDSWIAPALRVHRRLELSGGVAFVDVGGEDRRTVEYSAEGKVLLRPGSTHRLGAAVVGGVGLQQLGVPQGDRPRSSDTAY